MAWQGLSLSSLVFCIAISLTLRPEVEALDAELAPYGEVAPRGRTRRVHNHINIKFSVNSARHGGCPRARSEVR